MNKKHYKILLIMVVFVTSYLSALTNNQYIVPVDESYNIIGIMQSLYIESGMALPSSTMPYSVAELELMANQIKVNKLDKTGMKQYQYLQDTLNSFTQEIDDDIYYSITPTLAVEGYTHYNTEYFKERNDWQYDFKDQQKFFTLDVDFMVEDLAYSFVNFQLGASEHKYREDKKSVYFGSSNFATNIPFLDVIDSMSISTELSDRAFVAVGGNNWSAEFGRDQLSWGNGISGNLFLSDNLDYQNMGRFTFFGKSFKYTYVSSFFPFQGNYVETYEMVKIEGSDEFEEVLKYKINKSQDDILVGFSMFTAHKIEGRLFNDRLGLAISEGNMFVSANGTFDVAALNPMLSYHSLFYKANCNSIVAVDLDLTLGNNVNFYSQLVVDDLVVPIGESKIGKWSPDAYGLLIGLRHVSDELEYQKMTSLEVAYTTPYLYLRNDGTSNKEQEGYGINYIVALRKFNQDGIYYDKKFLGYEFGGDAIVVNFSNKIYDRNKWSFNTNLFMMCHGTFDIDTKWSTVGPDSNRDEVTTPTTTNYVDGSVKNSPEYTGILGLNFSTRPINNLSLFAQIDFVTIIYPDNVRIVGGDNFEADIQLTFGTSISY